MIPIDDWQQLSHLPIGPILDFLLNRQALLGDDYSLEHDGGFLIVEATDDIHSDFPFIGSNGLLSDLFDDTDDFCSPFEYASHHPGLWEVYLQLNDAKALVILVPDEVAHAHSDLLRLLHSLTDDPIPKEVPL